jgi:hypothetical protein
MFLRTFSGGRTGLLAGVLVLANVAVALAASVTVHVERARDGAPMVKAEVQQRAGGYYSPYKLTNHEGDVTFDIGNPNLKHCYVTYVVQTGGGEVCMTRPPSHVLLKVGGR